MSGSGERQHYGITLGILLIAALAYSLAQTLVSPALPEIQRQFDVSTTTVTFIVTGFLLATAVATPLLGRLGDIFGKDRVFVYVLVFFAIGAAVSALATSIWMMIIGRVIQGAAGAIFPLAFGIIRDEFPARKVSVGIGLIGATFGIGGGSGIVLSGFIVDTFGISGIFWISVAGSLLAAVAAHRFIPASPVRARVRVDWIGAGLLAAGLTALLVGVSESGTMGWTSPLVVGPILGGLAVLGYWVRFEARVDQPLVDMAMMRVPSVWKANLATFLVGFGMFSSFILIPQLVQVPESTGFGFGATVTESGFYLLPGVAVMLVAAPMSGYVSGRFGARTSLCLGTGSMAASFILLSIAHSEPWHIYLSSLLVGAGVSFVFAAAPTIIIGAVDQTKVGVSTGVNSIIRAIGGSIGSQVVATALVASMAVGGLPTEYGFQSSFVISALVCGVAFIVAYSSPKHRSGRSIPEVSPA